MKTPGPEDLLCWPLEADEIAFNEERAAAFITQTCRGCGGSYTGPLSDLCPPCTWDAATASLEIDF